MKRIIVGLAKNSFVLAALFLLSIILLSVISSYLLIKQLGYVRFISEPREDNPNYGYFEVNGSRYYQIYTTTDIKNAHVPPGAHIHAIDIRGEK